MSCWVVPAVAAEIWGIPLEQVMHRIRTGQIPTRVEGEFTFVDVAPDSPRCQPPRRRAAERPPTFTLITREELDALCAELTEEDELDETEDEPQTFTGDWRSARRKTARLRRAPRQLARV